MKKLPVTIFLYLCITLTSLHALNTDLEKVSIQLKWFYQYQFAGIFMAKEKGFYEDFGLDVTIKERDPKQNNLLQVIEGESEYGMTDSIILQYRAQGHPVRVIATIFQHNPMVLITKKESGIISPYEMKGKSISFQKGVDDSIVTSLLSFAHLNRGDIVQKPMDFTHMDFVNGEVDISEAYLSIEPYWMKKKHNIELNIIDPKNYGIDLYGDLLFTTQKEIDNHPQRVEAFKQATLKGWQYALDNREESIQVILDSYNTRDLEYEQLLYEARITETLISAEYIPLGEVRKERFNILVNLFVQTGIAKESLQKALNEIIYDLSIKENILEKYFYPILLATLFMILVIILLIYNNHRLKYLVKIRTKELEVAKQKAEIATESKSLFLANMSHEICTPMNAILGFVEQFLKEEPASTRREMLTTVEHSGKLLLTIINDILDFSKIESGKMHLDIQDCDIHALFNEMEKLFKVRCEEKEISFALHIDPTLPQYSKIDVNRLKQVIINILSNAVKFTDQKGKISLTILFDSKEKKIKISITDNGIGIAQENIDKIFFSFEQEDISTTRNFGGTGLGLSISEKLITLMKGHIKVESIISKGSTFTIILPYLESNEKIIAKQSTVIENHNLHGHVLVVEDNKTNQLLLGIILEEFSLSYDIANHGEEAIAMFTSSTQYDIILMDENMPIMDGLTAVKHIRALEKEKNLEAIPIIAVTANVLSEDKERFIAAGLNDYISKPYSEELMKQTLAKYLQR